jgi:hypothetical protein
MGQISTFNELLFYGGHGLLHCGLLFEAFGKPADRDAHGRVIQAARQRAQSSQTQQRTLRVFSTGDSARGVGRFG